MDQFVDVIEREKHVFNVEVKDPGAPVDFFINGKKVSKSDERCEYVNLGEGKHQLIIHHIKMEDLGTIEAKESSASPNNLFNGKLHIVLLVRKTFKKVFSWSNFFREMALKPHI